MPVQGESSMPSPDGEQSVDGRVRAWLRKQRDDLINMSRRNRLLHFKHTKTASLEIIRPAPDEILRRLGKSGANGAWEFCPAVSDPDRPPRQPAARDLLIADKDADQLDKALSLLERKTNQEFVDKGVWVLYLITRARRRVEIVTSVLSGDFPSAAASKGVRHLGRYLDFAQRGISALAHHLEDSQGDAESPFEEEVLRTIRGWGHDAVPQVGVAGYRIDIGVRHPARPGAYALGVECDGAMYHSSKVARDRDRLRQQVLEGLDWRIHRIWGTAWYRDRAGQESRLRAAIEAAVSGYVDEPVNDSIAAEPPAVHHETVDLDAPQPWTVEYRPAAIGSVRTGFDIHEPEARGELRRLIGEVVRQEGPVHEDRVLNAVRSAWGKGKSGSRIKEAFTNAVRDLCRSTMDRDRNGFLRVRNTAVTAVRVPGTDDPRTEREVRHVPPEELKLAIHRIVVDAHTVTHDDLSQYVARLFGWRRRDTEIRATLDDATAELVRSGDLLEDNGNLTSSSDLDDVALPGPVSKPSLPARDPRHPQLPLGWRPRRTRS